MTDLRWKTVLAALAPDLRPTGLASWQFTLTNGASHVVNVCGDGAWLILRTVEPMRGAGSSWEALAGNSSLPGLLKFVRGDGDIVGLRAELPVLDDDGLCQRLLESVRGMAAMLGARESESGAVEGPGPGDLKACCLETGWPVVERGGQRFVFDLEVPGAHWQAFLSPAGNGARLECELAALDGLDDLSRQAVGEFLLAASGLVRMGRAAVKMNEPAPVARFEVVFETPPGSPEISSALECLSVACSLFGEEVKTLQTPAVAERYLALRGRDAASLRRNERTITP